MTNRASSTPHDGIGDTIERSVPQTEPAFIPVVDVHGWQDEKQLAGVGRQIFTACTGSGFFYIRNHGIDDAILATAVEQYRRFFLLPSAEKARVAINKAHRGFSALGDALMYNAERPDYKEFYTIGLELDETDPDVAAGQPLRGANNWPDLPGFRPAIEALYEAMNACGGQLLRAVAVSLGQEPGFFAPKYRKRLQRMQGIYYPPQPSELADTFGVADHTDFGCVTLLWQDDRGGLEVLGPDGAWIAAPPIDGTLVINVGDLLQRWSNDRFASTRHRVINRSGLERFSIASFYDPSFDATIDPRDLGVPDQEAHYPPIAAGEHILGRINRSFGYRKSV